MYGLTLRVTQHFIEALFATDAAVLPAIEAGPEVVPAGAVDPDQADLDAGTVDVEFDNKVIQRSAIERVIESAGFDVPAQ